MKNRRIIFLAACMCSVVFLSGCSTDMNNLTYIPLQSTINLFAALVAQIAV